MTEPHERAINAPWSVLSLVILLLGGYAVQKYFASDAFTNHWMFTVQDFLNGRYVTLLTATFLHGSWAHVMGNAGFALAFATPVARRLGNDALGVVAFYIFYLVCGVLGNLGYALLNLHVDGAVLGASGAVAGMMGAASRLLGRPEAGPDNGDLAPIFSRPVLVMAASWIAVNLVLMVFGGVTMGAEGGVAWQVHLVGYAAGVVLFAPALASIGRLKGDHGIEN